MEFVLFGKVNKEGKSSAAAGQTLLLLLVVLLLKVLPPTRSRDTQSRQAGELFLATKMTQPCKHHTLQLNGPSSDVLTSHYSHVPIPVNADLRPHSSDESTVLQLGETPKQPDPLCCVRQPYLTTVTVWEPPLSVMYTLYRSRSLPAEGGVRTKPFLGPESALRRQILRP